MTEEAARNELAAVRLYLRVPDGESVMGFLRTQAARSCSTCRWWKPFVPGNDFMGECLLFECRENDQVNAPTKLELAATGSGRGKVFTEGDFFCSQFEKRVSA